MRFLLNSSPKWYLVLSRHPSLSETLSRHAAKLVMQVLPLHEAPSLLDEPGAKSRHKSEIMRC